MNEKWRRLLTNRRVVASMAAVAVLGTAVGFWGFRHNEVQADYLTAKIEKGDIIKTISATGAVQPLITVQVGSQVSGTISELFADYNSLVRKGQVVAKLDPAIFQAQLNQALANLTNARAAVKSAESAVTNGEANLLAAEANRERARVAMEDAQRLLDRTIELQQSAVVSDRDLESAQAGAGQTAAQFRQSRAQVEQAKAQLLSAKAQLNQAKAQVVQAKAAVELASVNLSHTIITAPIDGVVVARNVDVGQTVAASLQAPTLFLIANDLTKMQVLADIDEADVGQIGPQSRVTFTVDAYSRDTFRGQITQLRLNPQTQQTVVTYTAVINVENPDLKLKPGMTANVTVTVAERQGVLKVPNAALRFRPVLTEAKRQEFAALLRSARPHGRPARPSAPASAFGNGRPRAAGGPGRGEPLKSAGGKGQRPSPARSMSGTIPGWSSSKTDRPRSKVIWLLGENGQLRPVRVRLGITDGVYSELIRGDVSAHDVVVVGQNAFPDGSADRPSSPFGGPFGRRGRRH